MASPFDLVSLADLKSWLGITGTDDDILLAQLITQISRAIFNVIDRPAILPSAYTETYDGGNDVSIMLRQWPVTGVSSCIVDGVAIPPSPPLFGGASAQIGYVLDSSDAAPPGAMQRLSLRGFLFTCGVQNVMISYVAGYQITNESAGSPATGQYAVVNGVYTFAQPDAGSVVLVTYGYVPADLASCCMDWAAERYAYRSRIGQHSKSLGGEETMAFIVKDIPDFVVSALSPYRRVVMP